ncbi:ABC transporter permease [Domibacillus sp. DTU_2020_1001157_1_SI_ALB_TIR_016]|uniref:ABC transporter permease n=1 Tax=Domibacillus sp. DTU_2020_1001157_1_SI_ALB_TIR_016 TaxID=3077789 RepID=UPI0028EEFE1A|nr:ABC transporter permease [Domibacillus sp. DTU_2020_1001157_1_SI_ALB_TIR_016]WNS78348.1 ABC transporter permease [Domibacillus sp. DTU_2020_1001157_1_SI_ALB_TIR_016]
MVKFLLQRLLVSILVVWGSLTLVFFLLHILPGDAARMIGGETLSQERVDHLQKQFGLDRPIGEQYMSYITGIASGDLGSSFVDNQPVVEKLMVHFPSTLALTFASGLIAILIGVVFGVLSAIYQNSWFDYIFRFFSLFSVSMPTFWIGILLILIFSVHLKWFPAIGNGSIEQLVLPSVCLGVAGSGLLARMIRNSMLEVMNEQFVLALRAKGISEKMVVYQHVLRNALLPSITIIGILVGELLAGAVVTETVFSRQGIGRVVVDAINQKDIPMIQGAILIAAIMYIVVNLLVDLSYSYIDPRIRRAPVNKS